MEDPSITDRVQCKKNLALKKPVFSTFSNFFKKTALKSFFLALQVFGFVELRQFYSLKLSHLWSCQTLQDEKISYFDIRCRYNSIPLRSTPSLILGLHPRLKIQEKNTCENWGGKYHMNAIISCGLFTFYPIFKCGL